VPLVGIIQTAELGTQLLVQQNVVITYGRNVTKVTKVPVPLDYPHYAFGMYDRVNNSEKYCGMAYSKENLNEGQKKSTCLILLSHITHSVVWHTQSQWQLAFAGDVSPSGVILLPQ
jgi:hypothetical protein